MGEVYIYAEDCQDFTTMGLAGALMCDSCVHTEEANGTSEISLTHPIDDLGKWSHIQTGAIIKCDVPMKRKMPSTSGTSACRYYHYLSQTATGNDIYIWSKRSGGKKIFKIPMYNQSVRDGSQVRTEITIRAGDETTSGSRIAVYVGIVKWNKKMTDFDIKTYTGYINENGLDATRRQEVIENGKDKVDEWRVEEQLFRIYNVKKTDSGIEAEARHIFYDLLRNSTSASSAGTLYNGYMQRVLDNCVMANDFEVSCSMLDTVDISCENVNPVEAMLGSEGLLTKWGGEIVRNNWTIGVERQAGLETGMRIEYGRNLLGVTYSDSRENLVTAIKPIGQTKKGEKLELVAGTYTTSGGLTVVVGNDLCVHARDVMNGSVRYFDDCPEYALPYVSIMDMGKTVKATGTGASALLAARTMLVAYAIKEFELNKAYLPEITCDVDFVTLGDTDECKNIRGLEAVHLYDNLLIYHPKLGINVTAKVNRTQFDCLTGRMDTMELGNVQKDMSRSTISRAQMPSAVTSAIDSAGGIAEYASDTADNAQETAESKSKITTSETAPSSPESGDYWIQQRQGNLIAKYDGSRWEKLKTANVDTAVFQAALSDAMSNASRGSVYDATSNETYINAASGTTGINLIMNGATNGNPAYGLALEKKKLLGETKWGNQYRRYGAVTDFAANTTTPSCVKLQTKLRLAQISTGGTATGLEFHPIYGFKICETLIAGHRYKIGFSGKIESSTGSAVSNMFVGFVIGDKYRFNNTHGTDNIIGGGRITTTEQTFVQSDYYTITENDLEELKTCPYVYVSVHGVDSWASVSETIFTIHSVMMIDISRDTFPETFSNCKLEAYTNDTMKTKLDATGFKVSGFNADGTEKASMIIGDGASTGSNGVAAGGAKQITIEAASWENKEYTASIDGLKADANVIVSPDPTSMGTCATCNVRCTSQAAGEITFECDTVPTASVTMNVIMLGGLASW